MEYPKWLEKAEKDINEVIRMGEIWPDEVLRAIEMAKDAWAMAYLRGTGNGMHLETFLDKYNDESRDEIPYVAFDHPNDGGGV